jgi:excisionase family DNA binding protein
MADYLRTADWLAELLDVDRRRALQLLRDEMVPGRVRVGRQVRVRREVVEAWIEAGGSEQKTVRPASDVQ